MVIIESEAREAGLLGERDLRGHHPRIIEIVEAERGGDARLIMARETRHPAHDIVPLGEALAPPRIILGEAVKLGQIKSIDVGAPGAAARRWRIVAFVELRRLVVAADLFLLEEDRGGIVVARALVVEMAPAQHQRSEGLRVRAGQLIFLAQDEPADPRRRLTPLVRADIDEMVETIDPRFEDVRIGRIIVLVVEEARRIDQLALRPRAQEADQRGLEPAAELPADIFGIEARHRLETVAVAHGQIMGEHIVFGAQARRLQAIPAGIEEGRRRASLALAREDIMLQQIGELRDHVRIVAPVEAIVEDVGRPDQAMKLLL